VTNNHVQRRLAAILAADVVGYSRLMGVDEVGTMRSLKMHRGELVDPAIAAHHGRIVKTTGDGMLVEFGSIVDAVACAVAIQRGMISRNGAGPADQSIVFRIGINVGDIIIDGDDIFGDGVNVAARLETLCEPGGLCISRAANDQIRDKLSLAFADLGEQTVKNISRAVGIFGLAAKDIAALSEDEFPTGLGKPEDAASAKPSERAEEQVIRFCRSSDGVRIAYSCLGQGTPLVKTGHWLTHLEEDVDGPLWRILYRQLAKEHTFVRYDARSNGLSDREVDEVSFDAFVRDLEAVVDAAGLERFALLGISQSCAVSVAYAVRHPERVTRMVLHAGFAQGWNKRPGRTEAMKEQSAAMISLIRTGWGQDNPAFRQFFTSRYFPDATKEQADWFNELQRLSATPENAVQNFLANGEADVTDLLPRVSVPTLVTHCRDDASVPLEQGRMLAAGIPGARFIPLQSRSHVMLENEPAFPRFLEEVTSFLRE